MRQKKKNENKTSHIKGVARGGGPGVPVTPPLEAVFYSNNLQYSGCKNASTLCLTECDPPFEKSWLRPCILMWSLYTDWYRSIKI